MERDGLPSLICPQHLVIRSMQNVLVSIPYLNQRIDSNSISDRLNSRLCVYHDEAVPGGKSFHCVSTDRRPHNNTASVD